MAEDNADLRRLIQKVLLTNGYRVVEAADGEDAISRFLEQAEKIDLLLFDVAMAKICAKEAFDRIKEIRCDIEVLFVSGYGGDIIVDQGIGPNVSHLYS